MRFFIVSLFAFSAAVGLTDAFSSQRGARTTTSRPAKTTLPNSPTTPLFGSRGTSSLSMTGDNDSDDVLAKAIDLMYSSSGGAEAASDGEELTKVRIQAMIQEHPVMLFMKGTKQFPQCGFSDTATKILERLGIDFEAFDVLSDNDIREGIKQFSQWPTIPQLYINGEFIGGSDIMLDMFENGELKQLIDEL